MPSYVITSNQSLFPNWTPDQVRRSGIAKAVKVSSREVNCTVYHVDVDQKGHFSKSLEYNVTESNEDEIWDDLIHSKV